MSTAHLEIDAHVVVQLGSELISDSEQALLELVKNAYDGDATRCTIHIEPEWIPSEDHQWSRHLLANSSTERGIGRIVVEDNGQGISPSAVQNGWLMISASLKRAVDGAKKKTDGGRTPVGDKGLGRLATMRLGDVLFLKTRTKKEDVSRTVSFAWSAFRSGLPLSEIPVELGTSQTLRGRRHGTDVEILGLKEREYWENEANVRAVVSKLSTLVTPFRSFQDFNLSVRYNEARYELRSLTAEALDFASAKFTIEFSDGVLKLKALFAKSLFRGTSGEKNKRIYEQLL
ncbi:MAG: hypothetical protein EOP84_11610, partial [Verrucomicrobiaceae bacterium]